MFRSVGVTLRGYNVHARGSGRQVVDGQVKITHIAGAGSPAILDDEIASPLAGGDTVGPGPEKTIQKIQAFQEQLSRWVGV
jgi:hypothetical protein